LLPVLLFSVPLSFVFHQSPSPSSPWYYRAVVLQEATHFISLPLPFMANIVN
jgi:hypothetical protein